VVATLRSSLERAEGRRVKYSLSWSVFAGHLGNKLEEARTVAEKEQPPAKDS
jgi:hypothetical protein